MRNDLYAYILQIQLATFLFFPCSVRTMRIFIWALKRIHGGVTKTMVEGVLGSKSGSPRNGEVKKVS
jgi:hypothetical protein